LPAPPRPWLPPLPDHLAPHRPVDGTPPTVLTWGLVDRPAAQRQEPLVLDLAAGGGWLVLGGPGSGRTTALRTLLAAAVGQLTPHQVHVHVVDHAGGALGRCAELLPHTGTVVARGDGHRLHRLLVRLQEEVDRRRREPGPHPPLLLLVDGLDAVVEAVEELLPGTGTGALLRVLREGAAVGLTAVLTADRVLPGSRLAGAAGHRVVLPLADRADYPLAGVPVALVPGHRPPGRGLLGPDAVEVQLALPVDLVTAPAGPGAPVVPGRVEVVELPPDPPPPAPAAGAAAGVDVVLGPGGDDGAPVSVDLVRCGGLLVAGPPGSGRTTALAALGTRLSRAGTPVLQVGPATPVATVTDWAATGPVVPGPVVLDPVVPGHGVACHRVVVVDDLGRLPDPLLDALTAITGPGRGVVLVAAATPADVAAAFRGPAPALRRSRTALLLQPGRGDAELLGLRLPRDQLPRRPGSGWLVTPAAVTRVQVARRG
jgi:S-DNA-T family DNA segregation ATPase FtsK/SpoIIIE